MSLAIPPQFSLCQNDSCPQAPQCLRHLAYQQRPTDKPFLSVVNPSCYPQRGAPCPAFRSNEPIQLAWGIEGMLDTLPHATAKQVKKQIIAALGKSRYYRALRGEACLTPQHQQTIQHIFSSHGIDTPPAYHRITQDYKWFPD